MIKKQVYPKKVYELTQKHFELTQKHGCFDENGHWECPCFLGDGCVGSEDGPDGSAGQAYCKASILGLMKMRWNYKQQSLATKQ